MHALFNEIWSVTLELAPWLLLGTFASSLIHGLMPKTWIQRHLTGRVGVVKAVLFGVPLPLCSCGVIPAGLGLRKDGASKGASVGFLISTPQTGVDSMLVAAGFLGWPFAVFKVGAAAVTGVVGGLLTDRIDHDVDVPTSNAEAHERRGATLQRMWEHGVMLLQTIWLWLVFGILLSAVITTFIPETWVQSVTAQGTLVALLSVLLISLPMYVCATASVPIAAALVASGMPTGAALVFLMAGPATNIATIGAVYRSLGGRALTAYLGTLIGGSLLLGYAFDFVLPREVLSLSHEHGFPWYAYASAIALAAFLIWFAFEDIRALLTRMMKRRSTPAASEIELVVEGMTCNGCASRLTRNLLSTPGVESADVQLSPGSAKVRGSATKEQLTQTIEAAGFRVPAVQR